MKNKAAARKLSMAVRAAKNKSARNWDKLVRDCAQAVAARVVDMLLSGQIKVYPDPKGKGKWWVDPGTPVEVVRHKPAREIVFGPTGDLFRPKPNQKHMADALAYVLGPTGKDFDQVRFNEAFMGQLFAPRAPEAYDLRINGEPWPEGGAVLFKIRKDLPVYQEGKWLSADAVETTVVGAMGEAGDGR